MDTNVFQKYEIDCIHQAAGRGSAQIRAVSAPGIHRCRTYVLEGTDGSSFVKCLDAGVQNPLATLLTLDHEAEGYRFFSASGDLSLAQLDFFQTFPDGTGRELQVLGLGNLGVRGDLRTLAEVYLDATLSGDHKEEIAGGCGRTIAQLVSAASQSSLDRGAGAASVRRQTDRLLAHPLRQELLDRVEGHQAFPWAYHNRVIGEMNILVPRWVQRIRSKAVPQLNGDLDQLTRILTDRELISALAPGQSADRIIFSPCDRRIDNTLCLLEGEAVPQLFEVDLEYWGLETAGRLLGRYLAHWQLAMGDQHVKSGDGKPDSEEARDLYHRLTATFCYHFLAGDGKDSTELVLRAVSLGLAGFHAGIYYLHRAALQVSEAEFLIPRALDCLIKPDRYLRTAVGAAVEQNRHADPLIESAEQVLDALQPLIGLVQSASGFPSPQDQNPRL